MVHNWLIWLVLGIPNPHSEYVIGLFQFKDAWELSNEEKIETASRMKDKGTKYFKVQHCALLCYGHESHTGKYTVPKAHTKICPGPKWHIFPILTTVVKSY